RSALGHGRAGRAMDALSSARDAGGDLRRASARRRGVSAGGVGKALRMRTWVEVSIGALRRNWIYVRSMVPAATAVCAVVKADAYGHGAVRCAQEFSSAGAPWLAVTSVEEGAKLRQAGL